MRDAERCHIGIKTPYFGSTSFFLKTGLSFFSTYNEPTPRGVSKKRFDHILRKDVDQRAYIHIHTGIQIHRHR